MAAVKVVAELILLGYLLSMVASSPLKDKKDIILPRSSRIWRLKTTHSFNQSPSSSSTSRKGAYPDSKDSVARFDSSLRPPFEITGEQAHKDSNQDVFEPARDQVHTPVQTPAPTTRAPTTTSFGDRIQKNNQGCSVKGGCSTALFVSDRGATSGGVKSSFQGDHSQSTTRSPYIQQEQFAQTDGPTQLNTFEVGKNNDGVSNVGESFPDYEGLISTQDFSKVTESQYPSFEDNAEFSNRNEGIKTDQRPIQSSFNNQRPVINQKGIKTDQRPIQSDFNNQTPVITQKGIRTDQSPIQSDFNNQTPVITQKSVKTDQRPIQSDFNNQTPVITQKSVKTDQRPIQSDFNNQSPVITEKGISDFTNVQSEVTFPLQEKQHFNGPSGSSSSTSDFSGQNLDNRFSNNNEQMNYQDNLQPVTQSVFADSQSFTDYQQQQITGQTFDDSHQSADDGQYYHSGNPVDWLRYSVPGNPGEDYPILYQVPETSFSCQQQQFSAGIFGDMESSCQAFHVCKDNGEQASFLCPNGTVFNQQYFVCDWWYNFRCSDTPSFYNLNADLYWDWDSFTPSQVLTVPPSNNNGVQTDFQSGQQGSFGNVPFNENRRTEETKNFGHENSVKSTIAVDNSAISDRNRHIDEQIPEKHSFTGEKTNTRNNFQTPQQDYQGEITPSITTSFKDSIEGLLPPVSSFNDRNSGNTPDSSHFSVNKEQDRNNVFPVASDSGSNRQPSTDAGTTYPDKNGYRQQFDSFQSQDHIGQSMYEENPVSDNVFSSENPVNPPDLPVSFDSQNQFMETTYGTQNTHTFQENNGQLTQFDISQEVIPDAQRNGGSFDSVSQQDVQQGQSIEPVDGERGQTFNPNKNDDIKNIQGSFVSNQAPDEFVTNDRSKIDNVNQITQVIQQETLSPSSFGTELGVIGNRDESYNQQNGNIGIQNQRTPFDSNQQSDLRGNAIPDRTSLINTQDNSEFQQEHVSTSFESNRDSSFQNVNQGRFEPENPGSVTQSDINLEFTKDVTNNFENTANTPFGSGNNQEVQQEYITNVFDQTSDVFGAGRGDGVHTVSSQSDNSEFKGMRYFPDQEQISPSIPSTFDIKQDKHNEDFGQNYGDSRRNMDDYNRNQNIGQTETVETQQFNSDRNQNVFENKETHQAENSKGNSHSQQEHISIPFDEQAQNTPDNNRNLDVQGKIHNNVQNIHQDEQNVFFDNNQPNKFEDKTTNINSMTQNNQRVQQENIFNRDQNNISPNIQQHIKPVDIEQKNVAVSFVETKPTSFEATVNENPIQQSYDITPNRENAFGVNNPKISEDINGAKNADINPVTEQQYIQIPFNEMRPNNFDSPRNDGDRSVQEGYVIMNQGMRLNLNQQNNFRQGYNGNPENFQIPQNLRQQQVPVSFDNTHRNNFQNENSYRQEGNQEIVQQQIQSNFQSNSFPGNADISPQNANVAFQMRLNNFQPTNIHTMNRGGLQNVKTSQQRLSFRPYGQNNQNVVIFPENNPSNENQNQQNNAATAYSNEKGPSNQNFFITNAHQFQDRQPQSITNGPFVDRQPQSITNGPFADRQSQSITNGPFVDRQPQSITKGSFSDRQPQSITNGPFADRQPQSITNGPFADRQSQSINNGPFAERQPQSINNGPFADRQSQSINNGPFADRQSQSINNGPFADRQSQSINNGPFADRRPNDDVQDTRQYVPQEFNQGSNLDNRPIESPLTTYGNQNVNFRVKGASSENYKGRSVDYPMNVNVNNQDLPVVAINTDDVQSYNQQAPESPSSMSYNGWKPVIKY